MNDQKIHKADVLLYFNKGVYRAASQLHVKVGNAKLMTVITRRLAAFNIGRLARILGGPSVKPFCYPGEARGNGTTLQMPFGFLQMHCPKHNKKRGSKMPRAINQMQFHHQIKKIMRWI